MSLRSAQLYSKGHPIITRNLESLSAAFQLLHTQQPSVVIGLVGDEVIVDDFFTTTGLVVKTDTAGDGSFATTWTIGTDFAVEPANGIEDGIEGVAMMRLVAAGSKAFVVGRQRLKISTKWGWAATPDPVAQASAVVASALFKLKDAPLGQDWNDESSPIAVATNPKLRELLDDTPYSRRRR